VIFIPQKAVMKEFKNLAHLSKQDIWFLIIAGALEGIHYVFYFYSLHYTSAVAVSILNNVGEVFVAISGFIFFKEKITKGFVFAIFLAIVGTLITITNGDFTQLNTIFSSEAALGDLLILIAAFLFSLYAVIEKKVITRIGLVPLVAVTFFIGQLVLLPFTIPDIANAGSIPTFSWLLLIIIAIFGSAVGYYAFTKGIAISDMSIAGMITLSGPIFAILFAIIFVPGESLDLSQALGAILIIISIFLVTTKHKSKSSENEASSNIKTPKDDLFNDEVLNIETN
jgi:drug/metabolite transporter (DMT)-like permease